MKKESSIIMGIIFCIALVAAIARFQASPIIENYDTRIDHNILEHGEGLVVVHVWDKNRECAVKEVVDTYSNISTGDYKHFLFITNGKINNEYGRGAVKSTAGQNLEIEFTFDIPMTWNSGTWIGQRTVVYYDTCTANPFAHKTKFEFPQYRFKLK